MKHPANSATHRLNKSAALQLICTWRQAAFKSRNQFLVALIARRVNPFHDGFRFFRRPELSPAEAVVTKISRHAILPR